MDWWPSFNIGKQPMFRPWHILKILSGNQTWQWKIPYSINDINGGIHGKSSMNGEMSVATFDSGRVTKLWKPSVECYYTSYIELYHILYMVHICTYMYILYNIHMSLYICHIIYIYVSSTRHPNIQLQKCLLPRRLPRPRRRLILKICVEIPKKRKVKLTDWKWKWIVNGNGIGNGSFRISRLELDCTCLFGFLDWIVL